MDRYEYEGLKEYCRTDRQLHRLELIHKLGSIRAAAREEGVNESTLRKFLNSVRTIAAKHGFSPQADKEGLAAPGFMGKGKSTLYGPDGDVKVQWVKTSQDDEALYKAALAAIEALKSEIIPVEPSETVSIQEPDLLNLFVVTDYHLGMKAWGEETRSEDWDLSIAEALLINWFRTTIDRLPSAKIAVFAQLGDFLHWDGLDAVTPTSGHVLDADTRFQKVVRVAIRVLRECVGMLLEKHERVHIIHAEGNHDLASSIWLRELFNAFYANEPRVTIDISADPYYAFHHGETGLFFHHGHKAKLSYVDQVFVRKFREIYGAIKHAYGHTGHLHHDVKKENSLMVLEQHRTLSAPDAYSSRGGWNSGRDAKAITYHKRYGEVSRVTVNPDLVRDSALGSSAA